MSDMALEQCGGYDLLEDRRVKDRPLTNHAGCQITDRSPFQSDADDEMMGEKKAIPFLSLLQQQGIDPKVQEMQVLRKSKRSPSASATEELFQDNREGENPLEMQNTGICGKSQGMDKSDGFSTLTQKDVMGVEQDLSGNHIINPIGVATLLPAIFREYSEHDIQIVNHSPLSHVDGNNFSTFSLPSGEIKGVGSQKHEKFSYLQNSGYLFTTETTFMDGLTAETVSKRLNISEAKLLANLKNRQMTGQLVSGTIPASGFAASPISEINIKELPAAFKSQSHQVAPENVNTSVVPEMNALTNSGEKYLQNDLSKINGNAASQENVPVAQQTDKEGDFMMGQDNTGYTQDGAQLHKTPKGLFSPGDTQKTTIGTQAYANDIQKNTELFWGNNGRQLSSLENSINKEIQTYHGSSAAGTEHLHGSIMEQLMHKISLANYGDRSEIKLHLTPPELGSIKIHFVEKNDEIEAKIFVEDAEVKAAIENSVHRLKETVAVSGLEIQKLEVFIQQNITYEEKSSENPEADNQEYYKGKSHGGGDEGNSEQQNNVSNNVKKEFNGKTTNVMVDYII